MVCPEHSLRTKPGIPKKLSNLEQKQHSCDREEWVKKGYDGRIELARVDEKLGDCAYPMSYIQCLEIAQTRDAAGILTSSTGGKATTCLCMLFDALGGRQKELVYRRNTQLIKLLKILRQPKTDFAPPGAHYLQIVSNPKRSRIFNEGIVLCFPDVLSASVPFGID
ncbi:hypothetical protein T265_07344 [Opisthorchis viverrini]|uniref:Uncharacterized protein n=1 Tax=Opisthorchis viverrini TaxID=6198 RepID=A0A074ZHD2_OPIVI|nr:hypothetical protein T265_07344 [Opisthorchis viverrini]KER25117.1 hypothetical protein T265_07344 [Opisthorchis viverrini]